MAPDAGQPLKRVPCSACAGDGAGPFGRSASGWDIETCECVRCNGWGYLYSVPTETLPPRQD